MTETLILRADSHSPGHHQPPLSHPSDGTAARRAGDHPVELAIRVDPENPDHHLWDNNGTWFVHYTVYPTALTKERVRRSLKTRSVEIARQRRDELFGRLRDARVHIPTAAVRTGTTGRIAA